MAEDIRQRIIFDDAQSIGTINDIVKALQILNGKIDGTQAALGNVTKAQAKEFNEVKKAQTSLGNVNKQFNKELQKQVSIMGSVGNSIKSLGAKFLTLAVAMKVIKGIGRGLSEIAGNSAEVARKQEALSGKFQKLVDVLGQRLGPVFSSVIDLVSKGLDKAIGFVSNLSDAFGPKLAARISGSAAVAKAFFANTDIFIQRTVNRLEIMGKSIKLAFTFDDSKENSLRGQIQAIQSENDKLEDSFQDLGDAYKVAFDKTFAEETAKVQAGLYKETKKQADDSKKAQEEWRKQQKKAHEEAQKEVERLRKEYQALAAELAGKLIDAELDILPDEAKLLKQFELAKTEIDALEKQLRETAKAAGEEFTLAPDVQKLREFVEKKFAAELKELRGIEVPVQIATRKVGDGKPISDDELKAYQSNVNAFLNQATEGVDLNPLEKLKAKIIEALKIDSETFDFLFQSLGSILGTTFQIWSDNIDAQLEKNSELLDSIREQKNVVTESLEEETKKREEGYAANVESKTQELEELDKQEQAALLKREQLEKKKLNAQLLQDTLSQASSLAVGAANVIAQESKSGLPGIILAISAIALLFKTFASAKANARKASQSTAKAFRGGKVSDYLEPGTAGRTDRFGGEGHRVSDTNLVIGADEFIMNAKTTKAKEAFLRKLNSGKYDNVNIESLIDQGAKTRIPVASVVNGYLKTAQSEQQQRAALMQNALVQDIVVTAIERQTQQFIKYFKKERPIIAPLGGEGYRKMYGDGSKEDIVFKK